MQTASIPSLGGIVAQKYRLEREIGRGGMGIVYAATDVSLGRPVALKLLVSTEPRHGGTVPPAASNQDTARFMREARATAALRGDHVAQVYEAGVTSEGVPFLAMELLHGEDLERYVARRGPLPFPEACDLLLQACVALTEAHQLGIVHRDLKPQNFFVLPPRDATGPKLKVLDFGISKMTSEADLALTQTAMTMGSPRYMSPEQVRSSKYVDARADIWALGAVLFEALTGRPLFNENTASALHAQIIADHATPLRHVRVEAPPELELVVLRCVEKDPARRYGSAMELAQALAPFASTHGRDLAARLLAAHGFAVPPPAGVSAAVPYAASTPGFDATGRPVRTAPGAVAAYPPAPATRRAGSTLWTWVWIGVAVFCVLCIAGAALFALALGSAAQHPPRGDEGPATPASGVAPDAATPDDRREAPSTPTPPRSLPSRAPTPLPSRTPSKDAGATPSAAELAAKEEDRRRSDEMRDAQLAREIEQSTDRDPSTACSIYQHTIHNVSVICRGRAVAASLEACRRANQPTTVMLLKGEQDRCEERQRGARR